MLKLRDKSIVKPLSVRLKSSKLKETFSKLFLKKGEKYFIVNYFTDSLLPIFGNCFQKTDIQLSF